MASVRLVGLRSLRCPPPTRLFSSRVLQRPLRLQPLVLTHRGYATQPPQNESATSVLSTTLPESERLPLLEATSDPLAASTSAAASTPGLTDTLTDALTTATAIPALQYGDLAALGLATWSPIGLIAWSYELLQVTTGLPWFYTILAGSAFWRLVCVPFALSGVRSSAKLRPYQHLVAAARDRMTAAQQTKDMLALQRANLEIKSVYEKAGVSPLTGMILPMVGQLPITIGMFFALKRMCQAPLEQLKDSGVAWLPDLTVPDPTYILPMAFCALINVQIGVGARDIDLASSPNAGHLMNLFRVMSAATVYFMSAFPSGLFLGLLTTTSLTITQSLLLRVPSVRTALGIPILAREHHGRLPSLWESVQFVRSKVRGLQEEARKGGAAQAQGLGRRREIGQGKGKGHPGRR